MKVDLVILRFNLEGCERSPRESSHIEKWFRVLPKSQRNGGNGTKVWVMGAHAAIG